MNRSVISNLEKQALNICTRKGDFLEFQELKGIAELYAGIFFSRWLRGEISKAIRIGFIVTRMAQTMDSVFLKSLVLPRLAHLLMISRRHSEVVVLLRELGECQIITKKLLKMNRWNFYREYDKLYNRLGKCTKLIAYRSVIQKFNIEFASQNDLEKSGRTWYYAICADVQLDTGITILSLRNCEQYYLTEGESIISLHDPEAERRYFTSMWLW